MPSLVRFGGYGPGRPIRAESGDGSIRNKQTERLAELKESRDLSAVDKVLASLQQAAEGTENLLYPMREALTNLATLGEVSDALREVYGQYRPS